MERLRAATLFKVMRGQQPLRHFLFFTCIYMYPVVFLVKEKRKVM